MRKLVTILAVVSLLVVFSCGSSSTGPSGNDDYLPLAVGNQWNYSLSGYATAFDDDTTFFTGSNITVITGTTTHQQGFQLYISQDSSTTIMTSPDTTITIITTSYLQKSDTEIRLYDDTTTADYKLFVKLPITLGDTWTPVLDTPEISRTVLSLSASTTVPAGSYSSCANLRDTSTEAPDFYFNLFLARGTGVVKYVINDASSESVIYMAYDLTSSIIN